MSMKNRNVIWGVLVVIAFVVLIWPAQEATIAKVRLYQKAEPRPAAGE